MSAATPTVPPPQPDNLSSALRRNIEALDRRRREEAASATKEAACGCDHLIYRQHANSSTCILFFIRRGSWPISA